MSVPPNDVSTSPHLSYKKVNCHVTRRRGRGCLISLVLCDADAGTPVLLRPCGICENGTERVPSLC